MGYVAAPAYLGDEFRMAAPGHRFNLYLPLWTRDQWTREPDRQAEKDGNPPATGKGPTLRTVVKLGDAFAAMNRMLCARQASLAAQDTVPDRTLSVEAIAVAPFTTGLGNEHPLENGFAFLNPYGLPYLPGSGVKGVLRKAAQELACGDWGDTHGWTDAAIDALFGRGSGSGDGDTFLRGALEFWDVIPQIEGDALQVEVMTPHMTHYLQNGGTPHESGQPNPINFLTVPPGSRFVFHVRCDLPFLERLVPESARDGRWQGLLNAAMAHAFQWLGFGAKTAVGYGAMQVDPAIAARRERDAREAQAIREREAAEARRQQELAAMTPTQSAIREYLDGRPDKNQPELSALMAGLKSGHWDGEIKLGVARHVQALMQAARKWKVKSEKKNPQKDYDHQDTLLVMKWLSGK